MALLASCCKEYPWRKLAPAPSESLAPAFQKSVSSPSGDVTRATCGPQPSPLPVVPFANMLCPSLAQLSEVAAAVKPGSAVNRSGPEGGASKLGGRVNALVKDGA